jgi:hypothetical protein
MSVLRNLLQKEDELKKQGNQITIFFHIAFLIEILVLIVFSWLNF